MGEQSVTSRHGAAPQAEGSSATAGHTEAHAGTSFSSHGAIPPVASGSASASTASASDRAYGGLDAAKLPPGVDLQAVRASVMIPGNRKLAGGYWHGGTLRTRSPSEVGVEVTHTGVRVFVSPGLYLDADWPMQDCTIDGAGLDFAKRQPWASVNDVHGLGSGMISIASHVSGTIVDTIRKGVAGTKLVSGNYDPAQDPELSQTLDKVLAGFMGLFSEHDPGHAASAKHAPITPAEMSRVSVGATIAMRDGANLTKGGSGLTIAANGPISISVNGAGTLQAAMNAHDPDSLADADRIQSVQLSTQALEVIVKGAPVARIEGMTLARGGKVTIDQMTPLGKLAQAEGMESGLSLLAALVAYRAGSSATGGLYRNAQEPAVVDGVSRGLIEKEFSDFVHQFIVEHRTAVPGLDLARALGIG